MEMFTLTTFRYLALRGRQVVGLLTLAGRMTIQASKDLVLTDLQMVVCSLQKLADETSLKPWSASVMLEIKKCAVTKSTAGSATFLEYRCIRFVLSSISYWAGVSQNILFDRLFLILCRQVEPLGGQPYIRNLLQGRKCYHWLSQWQRYFFS